MGLLFGVRYKVDLCGDGALYRGAKRSYRAGDRVELVYFAVDSDTDYRFSAEGAELAVTYSEGRGYIISFIMPKHDVRLHCSTQNSMDFGE